MHSLDPSASNEDLDEDAASDAPVAAPRARTFEPPLSVPAHQREAFRRLFDPEHMLAVFRRELPPLCDGPIHVATCSVRPGRSDKPFKNGQLQLVYKVGIQVGAEAPKDYRLLGLSPAGIDFPWPDRAVIEERLRDHPSVRPFRELSLHIEQLQLALFLFPLDPALPGLATITGSGGARWLASFLPECRAGANVDRTECELAHYKPFNRAVLRVRAALAHPDAPASERTVYVKVFYNDRGADSHRDLASLWSTAQRSTSLRVPEPLGYDPEQRLLVMSEATGERCLNDWVRCLRKEQPLPAGTDLDRVERCVRIAARALHELQRSGLRPDERYTFADELSHLRRDWKLLRPEAGTHAEPVAQFERLQRRLEAMAPDDEPLVPAHGEYRHQQLVGDERSLTVIDWDSYCLANPALDAARFLARFRRDAARCPDGASAFGRLVQAFREEFLGPRPEVAAHLALYEGLHVTKLMLRCFGHASRGEDMTRLVRVLAAVAEELLDRAEAAGCGSEGSS